ncbi:uncharacterized protein LOC134565368 [Prinia subflava]|uniref:uncharacterized protein LOC134565368 n=1 Tax=Prinia subflava TaxID=208062 RepID=UPI002FE26860
MESGKVLEAVVAVVATLGELAATLSPPSRSVWPLLYPQYLHDKLRKFTWHLRDTLEHHGNVASLGRAAATLGATPGATWAEVIAAENAWRESVDGLRESWERLSWKAMELRTTWKIAATDEATAEATTSGLARDPQDGTAGWGTTGDNLDATAGQRPVALALAVATKATEEAMVATGQAGAATRSGQKAEAALGLLKRLEAACMEASMLPMVLQDCLGYIEFILKGTEEASPNVPTRLETAVAEAERLCEASGRLAKGHLLGTLREIDFLLSSPYGSTGGCSVAKHCQKASEDTLSSTAPSCGDTKNGSSIPGTPEHPEGTWGKPKPGAVCDIASQLLRDPDLLPPGTRCELATSELIRFLNNSCHECIPIGVTGISHQRQDFLIIGKDSNKTLGLSVLPAVVSANCNEELRVLALAYKAPVEIQPKTPIAIAIALSMNTNKRAVHPEMSFESSNPHVRWIKHITYELPEQRCSLTHRGETVHITGKLDTGSDVTIIPYEFWPSDWNLVPPACALTGIGGGIRSIQSESMITVTGPEGKTATTRPYVVKKPITLWGRDVMSQWRAKMELDS